MVARNTPVVIQHMLGIAPEALDAVDVVTRTAVDEGVPMTDHVMLAIAFEGLIPAEGVRKVDRALAGVRPDMAHEFLGGEVGDNSGIHAPIPFQQAKNDTFAGGTPAAFTFAPSAEVGFVQFDLAFEFTALEFRDMEQRFTQTLVNARDDLGIDAEILRQAVGRLQLIEAFEDLDLTPQLGEALALATVPAFHVAARRVEHAKRTAENALATPQKVGRTGKMTRFPCNHKHLSYACGYETP